LAGLAANKNGEKGIVCTHDIPIFPSCVGRNIRSI
jgi:hypothetical protein